MNRDINTVYSSVISKLAELKTKDPKLYEALKQLLDEILYLHKIVDP